MKTIRLYYEDSYQTRFEAEVVETGGDGRVVYLDRTAFYPASGGQPADGGTLGGVPVLDVVDEEERVAHRLERPLPAGARVEGVVDWARRFDHMQQHSGQHLLSALLADVYGMPTVSFHLGPEVSTIDVTAAALDARLAAEVERRVNALVAEDRALAVGFEDAAAAEGLRKQVERAGTLRIVTIDGLDRSACGGTHVRRTGEIGPVLLRKTEKIRGDVRLEFLCGGRAVKRARADFESLSAAARAFSSPLDDVPALVAAQLERLQASEKARRKAATELARYQGREAWQTTAAESGGLRRLERRAPKGAIDDELRAFAQGYTAGERALLVQAFNDPPTFLLAVSADAGVDAGAFTKQAVAAAGGRGGGAKLLAQGTVPSVESLEAVLEAARALGK
jgi:alanyl-tRNA synthetase